MNAMNYISLKNYAQNPEIPRFRFEDTLVDVKKNIVTIDFDNGDEVHIHFQNSDALVRVTQNRVPNRSVVPISGIASFLSNIGLEDKIESVLEKIPYVHEKILA